MPRSRDIEAQAPRAGQCQISIRLTPNLASFYRNISQSEIQDEGSHGAQVQIIGTKTVSEKRIPIVRSHELKTFHFLTRVMKGPKYVPKHGDTSAAYWNLYGSEAEIYDKNLVESLMGNTSSMVFLVRGDSHR